MWNPFRSLEYRKGIPERIPQWVSRMQTQQGSIFHVACTSHVEQDEDLMDEAWTNTLARLEAKRIASSPYTEDYSGGLSGITMVCKREVEFDRNVFEADDDSIAQPICKIEDHRRFHRQSAQKMCHP